jgi:four helix bundle protein
VTRGRADTVGSRESTVKSFQSTVGSPVNSPQFSFQFSGRAILESSRAHFVEISATVNLSVRGFGRNHHGVAIAASWFMKEPSEARKRTMALHERAIRFSTKVNRSFPQGQLNYPSEIVWKQLVRAADGTSNNLIEADNGSSDADFLNKMRTALREAKEAKACLAKIIRAPLANAAQVAEHRLEQEADELCAIYSTIITNMERRLAEGKEKRGRT